MTALARPRSRRECGYNLATSAALPPSSRTRSATTQGVRLRADTDDWSSQSRVATLPALAKELGISTTPLREALRRLSTADIMRKHIGASLGAKAAFRLGVPTAAPPTGDAG